MDNADKDTLPADKKCYYLETLDCNSKHEEDAASEKAAEPQNVDVQPTAEFTPKQVISFPMATNVVKDILSLLIKKMGELSKKSKVGMEVIKSNLMKIFLLLRRRRTL